jgi:hypothetical protein
VAVTELDPEDASELETLEAFKPAATPVAVREGGTTTVTLTLAAQP